MNSVKSKLDQDVWVSVEGILYPTTEYFFGEVRRKLRESVNNSIGNWNDILIEGIDNGIRISTKL